LRDHFIESISLLNSIIFDNEQPNQTDKLSRIESAWRNGVSDEVEQELVYLKERISPVPQIIVGNLV